MMDTTTNLLDYQPRIDALRARTAASVSVDLEVWWHRSDVTGLNLDPRMDWRVVTFDPDGKVRAFRGGPDLARALDAAERYHGLRP